MAVKQLYYCEKDGMDMALKHPETMLFTTKAEADARDKMLEVSEGIMLFLQRKVPGIEDHVAESCANAIAEDRAFFAKAIKKPDLFQEAELDDQKDKQANTNKPSTKRSTKKRSD